MPDFTVKSNTFTHTEKERETSDFMLLLNLKLPIHVSIIFVFSQALCRQIISIENLLTKRPCVLRETKRLGVQGTFPDARDRVDHDSCLSGDWAAWASVAREDREIAQTRLISEAPVEDLNRPVRPSEMWFLAIISASGFLSTLLLVVYALTSPNIQEQIQMCCVP